MSLSDAHLNMETCQFCACRLHAALPTNRVRTRCSTLCLVTVGEEASLIHEVRVGDRLD